tara:strand:+ start:329 stop:757 length:429 start_codon:yes stop_codon:yes gene_type:complete
MRSELENLIYFASFIDAEGYIEYAVRPKKNQKGKIYNSHFVKIEVTNTDFDIIYSMKEFFKDGYTYICKPRKTAKGRDTRPIIRYIVQYFQAYKILKKVLPYMRQKEKLDKVNKIIWWYENENMQAVHRVRKYQREISRYHH